MTIDQRVKSKQVLPSKLSLLLMAAAIALAALSGCAGGIGGSGPHDDFVIGQKLTETSAASDQSQVVLFDKTVRIIHEFDLSGLRVLRSMPVRNPQQPHSVLFEQGSGLIADFSDGHMTLFDRASVRTEDPVLMVGKAISYAINPTMNRLVVYDDMSTIGLIQYSATGSVVNTFVGGPSFEVGTDSTVTAGDLLDNGQLALALSNGKIALVDFAATLGAQAWQSTLITTTLTTSKIKWVAPIHGVNDRIFVLTDGAAALVSLVDGSIIAKRDLAASEKVKVMSKATDGHLVLQTTAGLILVYSNAGGNAVLSKSLNIRTDRVFNSRYSSTEDAWSFIDSRDEWSWTYNAQEGETKDRHLRRYQVSSMRAVTNMPLPDTAQLDISQRYVFALYPSELGKGERLGITDGSSNVIRGFNAPYIHQ